MEAALVILAVLGFVAALLRLLRAAFGALRHGVDEYVAREAAEARARRGDLTGMAEAQTLNRGARRARIRALAFAAFWLVLLVAPPFTPWARELYAACSLLWLFPLARPALRPR
jgi:hypothetical protein